MTATTRTVKFGLFLLVVLLTTGLVYADESIFFNAAVGNTTLDESIDLPIDDDDTAFRVGVGYGFGNDIALEASYINFGDFTGITSGDFGIDGRVQGAALSAVFTLPLSNKWAATVRGGVMAWEAKLRTPDFREKIDGDDVFYGLGLQANVSDHFALTGEWQRYELDQSEADVLFIGAQFRF